MNSFTLEEARPQDCAQIFSLAHKIWHKHYPEIITVEQIDYMLQLMYAEEVLISQLERGVRIFLIGQAGVKIGFIAFEKKAEGEYFLHKFYIDPLEQNKGLGTSILQWLWRQMPDAHTVRLAVNRRNFRSVNFYFKNGFVIEKCAELQIGNGYAMDDFIMKYVITC